MKEERKAPEIDPRPRLREPDRKAPWWAKLKFRLWLLVHRRD